MGVVGVVTDLPQIEVGRKQPAERSNGREVQRSRMEDNIRACRSVAV